MISMYHQQRHENYIFMEFGNPLAPRLVTAVYEFTLSSNPVAEASAFAGTAVRQQLPVHCSGSFSFRGRLKPPLLPTRFHFTSLGAACVVLRRRLLAGAQASPSICRHLPKHRWLRRSLRRVTQLPYRVIFYHLYPPAYICGFKVIFIAAPSLIAYQALIFI